MHLNERSSARNAAQKNTIKTDSLFTNVKNELKIFLERVPIPIVSKRGPRCLKTKDPSALLLGPLVFWGKLVFLQVIVSNVKEY
jgi:hypothetical protein